MKKSLEKLLSEISKKTKERESLRQTWETKHAETEKQIATLESKLQTASDDFETFRKTRAALNNAKEYRTEVERKLKALSVPTDEERKMLEDLKARAREEVKSIAYDLGTKLEKERSSILQLIADALADQTKADDAIKEMFKTYGKEQQYFESIIYNQYAVNLYTSADSIKSGFEELERARKKGAPL